MHLFTLVFLAATGLSAGLRIWLALRHIRHVAANRCDVPTEFDKAISLESHQKAADYTIAKTRFGLFSLALEMAILIGLTLGGGLQWLRDLCAGWLVSDLWQGVTMILLLMLVSGVINLPLSVYSTFVLEARFGFNKMTLSTFIGDMFKGVALGLVLGVPLLTAILWLMTAMGSNWWVYVWLVWVCFNLIVLAIYPTFIAPIFNKFGPLEDMELKSRIDKLLNRCGFTSSGLFVMDGSKRSAHGNAYFTGFGKTKRIVFYDTLLKHLSTEEVEAVLAHELGHFKHHHVLKRIVMTFAISLLLLWGLGWLMKTGLFYTDLGVSTPSTALALVLFFLVQPVFLFPLTPLTSFYSRKHEFEADRYAARQANANDLVTALVKLYRDNASTLTPDPLHSTFYDSHPPAAIRIARLKNAG